MLPLFHLSVATLNVFSLWYDQMYVDLPFPSKEIEELPFKARLIFVTIWCLILQTVYFTLAFLNDFIGTNAAAPSNPPIIRKIKDAIFTLAFPCALFVAGVFWGLYFINKDLIFPDHISCKFPVWMNHVMHTLIAPFAAAEMQFSKITYPPRSVGLTIILTFAVAYVIWTNFIYFLTGQYAYPFLALASWPIRIVLFCIAPVGAMGIYYFCEYLNTFGNPRKSKVHYSNAHSKNH